MRRSLYPDGCLVGQPALENTESTKSSEILVSRTDTWELGVQSGLSLTVNAVNLDRIDLSAGSAYAPNGELAVVSSAQLNQALADTTLGAINYVFVFYTEVKTDNEPHETNGKTYPTKAEGSFRFRVLTPSQFALLPASDPTYANDAQDRAVLVGIVTATGGNLTQGNIQQAIDWRNLKFATVASPGINGVSIRSVSDATPEGLNGQLIFSTSPNRLQWKAPGEAAPGVAVNVPSEADYTLTALGGSTIVVHVVTSALPLVALTVTVAITGVYSQDVPRMSAADRHHRSLIGSGIPTKTNPHGLSIKDIDPDFVSEMTIHQELMHAAGIWRGSSPACLRTDIVEVPGVDYLSIIAPTNVDTYWAEGVRKTSIANSQVVFTDSLPGPTREVFEIFVDDAGVVSKSKRLSFPLVSLLTGVDNGLVYLSPNVPAGTFSLTWDSNGPGLGGSLRWGSGRATVIPAGVTSGLFSLWDGDQEAKFFIANVNLLPQLLGTYTDNITVFASVDRDRFVVTAQVFWSGSGTGSLGYTPNRGFVPPKLIDQRLFGNLTLGQLRDDFLQNDFYRSFGEKTCDGLVMGTTDLASTDGCLAASSPGGLFVNINGFCPLYVKGKRFVVKGAQVSVANNALTVVYVDTGGLIQTCDFQAAAFLNNGNEVAQLDPESVVLHGAALALVGTSGGNVLFITDLRRNVSGGNENVQPWSVGIAERPNLFTRGAEFFDLSGALIYAAAASQTELTILTTRLKSPVVIGLNPTKLSGGTIFVDASAANGLVSVFGTFAGSSVTSPGSQLTLSNLQFRAGNGAMSATTTALIGANNFTITRLEDVGVTLDSFGGLLNNFGASIIESSVRNCKVTLTTAYGDLILQVLPGTVEVDGLDFRSSTVLGTFNSVVNALSTLSSSTIRRVLGNGMKVLTGAGPFTDVLVEDCMSVRLGALTAVCTNVQFAGSKFVDSIPGSVVNAANTGIRFDRCTFGNSVTQLTGANTVFDSCTFVNQLSLANTCTDTRIVNCKGTDIVQVSGAYVTSGLVIDECQLSGNITLPGTNTDVRISQSKFSTFSGAASSINIFGCNATVIAPGQASDFTNAKITDNVIGRLDLAWTTGQRSQIKVDGNTFTNTVTSQIQAFEVGGTTISRQQMSLKIINNFFIGAPAHPTMIYVDNLTGVEIRNNSFSPVYLTTAGGPIINVGLGFASNPGHTYSNVKIENNTFDIATVEISPLPNFGQWVVLFSTLNTLPGTSYEGGNSFNNNHVVCRDGSFNKVLAVLHSGFTRGFQCIGNLLNYMNANADVNWASPAGAGAVSQAASAPLTPIPAYPMALLYCTGTYPGAVVGNTGQMDATQIDLNQVVGRGAATKWICAAVAFGGALHGHSNVANPYFDFGAINFIDRQLNL